MFDKEDFEFFQYFFIYVCSQVFFIHIITSVCSIIRLFGNFARGYLTNYQICFIMSSNGGGAMRVKLEGQVIGIYERQGKNNNKYYEVAVKNSIAVYTLNLPPWIDQIPLEGDNVELILDVKPNKVVDCKILERAK